MILYQGLKEDKFYWEFVNTLRKFLILSVFGMLSSISLRLGIIIGVIIMTAIMRLQQYLNPYKNEENNYIEIIAIEAAIVTIVAALIFLQENSIEILNVCILVRSKTTPSPSPWMGVGVFQKGQIFLFENTPHPSGPILNSITF